MEQASTTLQLNNLDVGNVTSEVKLWSSNASQDSFQGGINGTVQCSNTHASNLHLQTLGTQGYYYQYPYTWFTYGTQESNYNKILVTKAENGFVLVYNGKTFIARTENDVAKIIVKVTKGEKNG